MLFILFFRNFLIRWALTVWLGSIIIPRAYGVLAFTHDLDIPIAWAISICASPWLCNSAILQVRGVLMIPWLTRHFLTTLSDTLMRRAVSLMLSYFSYAAITSSVFIFLRLHPHVSSGENAKFANCVNADQFGFIQWANDYPTFTANKFIPTQRGIGVFFCSDPTGVPIIQRVNNYAAIKNVTFAEFVIFPIDDHSVRGIVAVFLDAPCGKLRTNFFLLPFWPLQVLRTLLFQPLLPLAFSPSGWR